MRAAAAACVWTALWSWAGMQAALSVEDVQWRRVLFEESLFTHTVMQTSRQLSSVTLCGAACMRQDWCNLWCRDPPTTCLLTSLIVSGSYQPSEPYGARTCYTRSRGLDMAYGANITSSPPYNEKKIPANLVNGFHTGIIQSLALVVDISNTTGDAWFLLDLGDTRTVSEVMLVAQLRSSYDNGGKVSRFRDVEVKVGDVQESGDFTSYTLLGTFQGPALRGERVTLRPPAPLEGRYVSIQKKSPGDFTMAHLEIY